MDFWNRMNLPNKITIIRVLLIPFYVVFQLLSSHLGFLRFVALLIFLAASLTDYLDGYLARKNDEVTNFGKFMDPLADKLLVCSALVCLVDQNLLPAWAVIIIIAREFAISAFRLIASDNHIVIAASWWGKGKTVSQMALIVVSILNIPALSLIKTILLWVAVALTLISLADYIYKNRDVLLTGGM